MRTTLKGIIRYDGTDFSGWQIQPEKWRTVQRDLEAALSRIANKRVQVLGASRTDSGVHAFGQVFSCAWPGTPPKRLRHALSKMLAPTIRLLSLEDAPRGFNARFDARGKRYSYSLDFNREADPLTCRYAWHIPFPVDLDCVREMLPRLVGTHDFAGFQSTGSPTETTVRTVYRADLVPGCAIGPIDGEKEWRFIFEGDGFLYHMVRNIAGTLIEIGRGHFGIELFEECMTPPGPFRGHCAPAHGLVLEEVFYGEEEH
jgi:tRNA pseudouridine38-40 synthase